MKYEILRQGPEERSISSNVPQIGEPWVEVASFESDKKPEDLDWAEVIRAQLGESISREAARGTCPVSHIA